MGTLADELAPYAGRLFELPRIYADANVPAGLVTFMRTRLKWDVWFVMEHDELRRARDIEHYRLARQMHRTLVTLDRDYLDDREFPPDEGPGVLVLSAPNEQGFMKLLRRLHRAFFEQPSEAPPLLGRKLMAHVDWSGETQDRT
jgi:predicted nuclease of predicted toxin-antitoxin system